MPLARVLSYGSGHGHEPWSHVRLDLATHFRDPHVSPELRQLTGEHPDVIATVLATPGIPEVINGAVLTVLGYLAGPAGEDVWIAVGCIGGRHRSVAVANRIAAILRDEHGVRVYQEHRDLHRPVLDRGPGA